MKAIIESLQHLFQQPRYAFQSSLIASSSIPESESGEAGSKCHFFVAKDFSKQASYFFRVDSSAEYISEPEERKQVKNASAKSVPINYSVGIKRLGKWLVFPLVFCWIVLETAFEFIIDSDEGESEVKEVKKVSLPRGNSYVKKD